VTAFPSLTHPAAAAAPTNCCRSCRRDYIKLWSEQRRYLVSELLPDSGAVEAKPAAAAGKGGKAADKGKPAAPLVPQGAMKAQAIIAAALAEADAAVAAKRLPEPQPAVQEEPSEPEEEEEAAENVPAAPAGETDVGVVGLVSGVGLWVREKGQQKHYRSDIRVPGARGLLCGRVIEQRSVQDQPSEPEVEEEAAEVPAAPAGNGGFVVLHGRAVVCFRSSVHAPSL
jgi:hypothetical protein